jgi:hypothetical protein
MHIAEVTWRQRNDFHFIAECRYCGYRFRRGDGYADACFQQEVLPSQHCPNCRLNESGALATKATPGEG